MLTVIESPYAGDIEENVTYARACMRAVLLAGGTPFASHLLYTQPGVLRDEVPEERQLGMGAGWSVYRVPGAVAAVCLDRGLSGGMVSGVRAATKAGARVVLCTLQYEGLVLIRDWRIDDRVTEAAAQLFAACDPAGFDAPGPHIPWLVGAQP